MIAMMFPTAAPMILVFARVQRDRHSSERALTLTWVFVGAYLLIWTLFGGLCISARTPPQGSPNGFPGL